MGIGTYDVGELEHKMQRNRNVEDRETGTMTQGNKLMMQGKRTYNTGE